MNQLPQPLKKNNYYFVLGHQPLLAAAELRAVLKLSDKKQIINNDKMVATVNDLQIKPSEIIKKLGGTIKIAKELSVDLEWQELRDEILSALEEKEGKIIFGLSYYGSKPLDLKNIQQFGLNIKKTLKEDGRSVRYVQNRELILSSAVVENNKLTKKGKEFLIFSTSNKKFVLAQTCAIQPFVDFSERDYDRPGFDDKSGMLPPKLAMIMINLAKASLTNVILDPFCGSGTILTESALLGFNKIIGSDITERSINDSGKNLEWIIDKYNLVDINYKLHQLAVETLSEKIKVNSIDTIITEPYLGKPLNGHEDKQQLIDQANELKKLYLSAFTQFKKVLRKNSTVIFIIPRFKYNQDWVIIDCLEEIKKLGFTPKPFSDENEFLLYHRAKQYVGREIWRFLYN